MSNFWPALKGMTSFYYPKKEKEFSHFIPVSFVFLYCLVIFYPKFGIIFGLHSWTWVHKTFSSSFQYIFQQRNIFHVFIHILLVFKKIILGHFYPNLVSFLTCVLLDWNVLLDPNFKKSQQRNISPYFILHVFAFSHVWGSFWIIFLINLEEFCTSPSSIKLFRIFILLLIPTKTFRCLFNFFYFFSYSEQICLFEQ